MAPDKSAVEQVFVQAIAVQVAYAPQAETVDLVSLTLPAGATVGDALEASGLLERHGLLLGQGMACGVWAKLRPLDHPLREGDRVEVYRPLKVDPKEARRQRYRKERGKGTTKARARTAGEDKPSPG